jgi:mono/diheme cytochrome c family protein
MLADTNLAAILLLALGGLFLVFAIAALILRQRTKSEGPEVPHAMRPGPSDTALETPVLQRLQAWGVILVVFFVAWWPAQWLFEPSTNAKQEEELTAQSIERGSHAVQLYSEENQLGVGCVRCHGPELKGGAIYALGKYWNEPNLTTVCGGPYTGHARVTSLDSLYTIIEQGLGDESPMPSWSIRYKGALPDQTINDIVLYLVSIQDVPDNENVCTNPDASAAAIAGEPAPTPGGTPTPEATDSATIVPVASGSASPSGSSSASPSGSA